jgi:hypothetical protein
LLINSICFSIPFYFRIVFTCVYSVVQIFAYKMTAASENSMLKHRNVDLNTVSLKASDCTWYNNMVVHILWNNFHNLIFYVKSFKPKYCCFNFYICVLTRSSWCAYLIFFFFFFHFFLKFFYNYVAFTVYFINISKIIA